MIKKSIAITEYQEAWIQSQLATGRYVGDSEVMREALREKEIRTAVLEALRARLIASEAGGFSGRTPEQIRADVRAG